MGMLVRKEMDLSLLFAEKADRAKVIDYSLPFFVQKCRYWYTQIQFRRSWFVDNDLSILDCRLYIAAASNDYDFWAYTDVFSDQFWWFVLASLAALVATKLMIEMLLTSPRGKTSKYFIFPTSKEKQSMTHNKITHKHNHSTIIQYIACNYYSNPTKHHKY